MNAERGPRMDIAKIIAELKSERDQIDQVLTTLERLDYERRKPRGRPPQGVLDPGKPKKRMVSIGRVKASARRVRQP
jgi:hypothetical protein